MALLEGVKEIISLSQLCKSINIEINSPRLIYEDNQGSISISNNTSWKNKTKYIDIAYNKIREVILKGQVTLALVQILSNCVIHIF